MATDEGGKSNQTEDTASSSSPPQIQTLKQAGTTPAQMDKNEKMTEKVLQCESPQDAADATPMAPLRELHQIYNASSEMEAASMKIELHERSSLDQQNYPPSEVTIPSLHTESQPVKILNDLKKDHPQES